MITASVMKELKDIHCGKLMLTDFMPLLFLYVPKSTLENLMLSYVFRGYVKRPVA